MNFLKKLRNHAIWLTIILFIIIFTYWNLPNTFFQQDEWQTLTENIYHQNKGVRGIIQSFFPADVISHFNPAARVFSWFEYSVYYTNFTPYAFQSIVLHILNAFLLYYFAFTLIKRKEFAFISAVIFSVNSIPSQAVTWVAAANSYEVPTAFILLSLLFFYWFLKDKKNRLRHLLLSLSSLFISLLFHENGIFLILFYPIIIYLHRKSIPKKILKIFSLAILTTITIFILIRVPFLFGFSGSLPVVTDISHPPVVVYPYRIVSLAMKSFAGSFFPQKNLISISEEVVKLAYPQFIAIDGSPNPFITQSVVFDLVSYGLGLIIVSIIIVCIRFVRNKEISDVILWFLLFVPLSVCPYAFVLGKAGYASIFEPKFLYITSIGTSILLGTISYWILSRYSKLKILAFFVVLSLLCYTLFHVYQTKSFINELEKISVQRKAFLTTIISAYPSLPREVIFYTQSNMPYYGMPETEKILPVQVGFGKMLMVWYQAKEHYPVCFYEGQFLLPLLEEGYRKCEGRGFGYVRDYKKLEEMVKIYNIPIKNIIAFSWNGNRESFIDITKTTQDRLLRNGN